MISVGTKVLFTRDILHMADDYAPTHFLAFKNEETEIVKGESEFWDYYVYAPSCQNLVIGIKADEIKLP